MLSWKRLGSTTLTGTQIPLALAQIKFPIFMRDIQLKAFNNRHSVLVLNEVFCFVLTTVTSAVG